MSAARAPLGLALALALLLPACAPRPARFVKAHRLDEAVCAASVFSDDKARDSALVLQAINAHVRPAIHLHAITRKELTDAIGPAGERVNDRVLIVRMTYSAEGARGLVIHPDLEISGGPGRPVSSTRELLAGLTAESLPTPTHVETGPSLQDKAAAMASSPGGTLAGLGELLTLGIVPVMEIAGVVPPHRSYDVPPTDETYLKQAPAAEMLYRSFQAMAGTGAVLIYARPSGDGVALRTRWSFDSYSYEGACQVVGVMDVPLAAGGSVEERINRRFGDRLQPVALLPLSEGL